MMVEVDVEEHRDLRPHRGDRTIGLVALDDEPALARARVSTQLWNVPADEERRIEPESVEAERDHRTRRRLAVRAGDDDRAAERDELREQIGPRPARDPSGKCGGDVHLPAGRRLRWLRRDGDVDPGQMREVGRVDAVPAGHLGAPRMRDERVCAHSRAADAGDPDASTGERLRARRAHRRSSPLHRAVRRHAWLRPSRRAAPGRRGATRRAPAPGERLPPGR